MHVAEPLVLGRIPVCITLSSGLLAVGFNRFGNELKLRDRPIRHLFDVYVAINQKYGARYQNVEIDTHSGLS